ncbi:MAG: hypothetical protein IJS03_02070 [Eubacterium sp.]|nr:hypothetical protein [Eubacterium sp.]
MKKYKAVLSICLALVIAVSGMAVLTALANTNLLAQYTFENGMPSEFTPKSYDGNAKKPKVVFDEERGQVLRQYFGAGTGSGNGDPAGESYVEIAENPYADVNIQSGVTFMLWTKTAEDAPWDYNDTILSFNNATTRFALNNCPYLNYNVNGADKSADISTSVQQSVKGQWKHYAFTVTQNEIKIFVDGQEVSSNTTGNLGGNYSEVLSFISSANTELNLGLGGYFGSQDCFMDDIRFYSGVMSDEDIFEIYEDTVDYVTKNTKSVSHAGIHDPSIIACYTLEDGTQVGANDPRAAQAVSTRWWAFGSHMGVIYSDDLINWHNYASGFDENNPVINYTDESGHKVKFTDMLTYDLGYHGDITGMWAGCAIWLPEINKWALYGSCTSVLDPWGYNSVLWVMYSDKIEGPYKDPHPMVYTNPSFNVSNSQSYIASVCPQGASYTDKSWWSNTIRTTHTVDPTTFYDKEGDLWMIYGSYNSLFILPMDESTGLPDYEESYQREVAATNAGKNDYANNDWKCDWYWGTRINYTNYATDFTGEGTFIYYDSTTDYYYLYITYGGFAALGGYNLRVLRSRTPEGPYVDAKGQDLLTYLDSDSTPVNAGVKLTGNYKWDCNSVGYMSPGHDSVLCETVDGVEKIFQMYHVRFDNKSEGFFDQLHQMARTKDDWTIMLPYEYYGETIEYDREYTPGEIAGAYEFIDLKTTTYHIKDESDYDSGTDIVLPTQHIVLTEDGKIYGVADYKGGTKTDFENAHKLEKTGIIGTWSEDDGSCYADFTIDGNSYTGLFTYQYDESKMRNKTLVFAATGDNRTIWGSKVLAGSFTNKTETLPSLEKQVTVDGGEVSDSSITLYGDTCVVNDKERGSALFIPENDAGYATIDNPYYQKELGGATITFWAKITEQADFDRANVFMSFINNSSDWQYFTVNTAPQAHIFYNEFADFYCDNVPSQSFDKWHYYALTVDGGDKVAFYIDGVKIGYAVNHSDNYDASAGSILKQISETQKVYLGKTLQPSGAEWSWSGQECCFDNICFYSSILTSNQLLDRLIDTNCTPATTAPESISEVGIDPIVYTHGTGSNSDYMYTGNIISSVKGEYYKKCYLYIPDDFELVSYSCDNGKITLGENSKGYFLKGTVNRTNSDMALTLYLKRGSEIYRKTVYTFVKNTPLDAHVAEWNCINSSSKKRSLCHISRLVGSTGSGGSGDFAYLDNIFDFNATGNSADGMGFTNELGRYAGAYAYSYSSVGITNQSIRNETIPKAVYNIDKSQPNNEYWDGSQYKFTWRFTTVNGNSSAINSTGRNVYGESSNSAVWLDTSAGAYDDSPNYGGNTRDYYVYGNAGVTNNTITVSMTQGSSPKASVNHRISLTVNLYDKSLVRNALKEYEKLYEGAYSSDSWAEFETAKRNAWRYLNDGDITDDSASTQQYYINALDAAAAALEVIDYTQLEILISNAKSLNADNYTDKSLSKLIDKADEYADILGAASSQAQVDRACSKLSDLFGDLVNAYKLSGYITDSLLRPVSGASISGDGINTVSYENGYYEVKLESGEYDLGVSSAASVDRSFSVNVTSSALPGSDITIINCDINQDGKVNGRDLAHAKTSSNNRALAEINHTISDKGTNLEYAELIFE